MRYIETIQQILIDNNLSQQKFAETIGVNQTTVSQWLLGKKKPSYDSIQMICEKYNVEPNTFFKI